MVLNPDIDMTMSSRALGEKRYELTNHLGNVLAVVSDKRLPNDEPDVVSASDYYPYGMIMPDRNYDAEEYRYGFGGHEKDDEVIGEGNHLSFGDYGYDPRLGRRWDVDPFSTLFSNLSSYIYALNNPIQIMDNDGQFPILINGNTSSGDFERASALYWDANILKTISANTRYEVDIYKMSDEGKSSFGNDFFFVDGNKGFCAKDRFEAGKVQAKIDAEQIWCKMKETMQDGQITEQLQVITHSRGSAFGAGYMEGLRQEILNLAETEGIGFSYDKNSIIQYSINLAPHQSNKINYEQSGTININISHIGDPLSGNDATGDVINIHSIPQQNTFNQHSNGTYNTELNMILKTLENDINKDNIYDAIMEDYKEYDSKRTNGDKSSVKYGNTK